MKKYPFVLTMAVLLAGYISGMAETGLAAIPDRYNISMVNSGSDQNVIPDFLKAGGKTRKAVFYVAEFIDARQADDKKIVGQVREIGDARVPVYLKNDIPGRIIARAVKDYLKRAGYNVSDKALQWDLKEGSLPKKGPRIVVGGSLDELEVSCWTGVFSNDYKVAMKITLVMADSVKTRILYKGHVSVSVSKTDVSYSEAQLGRQADLAMAEAIGKLFEEKTIAEKIKEALAQ